MNLEEEEEGLYLMPIPGQMINNTATTKQYCNLWYLCSVPMVEAPGDAMSECSDGIQGEGPTLHHMTTKDKRS